MASDISSFGTPPAFQLITGLASEEALGPIMQVMQSGFDPRFGEAWNFSQTRAMLAMPLSRTVIAETLEPHKNGGAYNAVGFAMTRRVLDEEELLLIAVMPEWRRCGIASSILDLVIENARHAGVVRLFLEMRSNNPAEALYRSLGFAPVGTRRDYYTGEDSQRYDALTMAKPL